MSAFSTSETKITSLDFSAGVCQLMEALTAAFGEVIIPGKLVIAGNSAATATNIRVTNPGF